MIESAIAYGARFIELEIHNQDLVNDTVPVVCIGTERGKWKEIIVNQKTYKTILTFHPAYLLRQPEQKKYSWNDLKMIRKRIDELKISI